jgi:hypothetical protein
MVTRQRQVAVSRGAGATIRLTTCRSPSRAIRSGAPVARRPGALSVWVRACHRLAHTGGSRRSAMICASATAVLCHGWLRRRHARTARCESMTDPSAKLTRKRHTIEEMHALAATRGGRCLSDHYVKARRTLNGSARKGTSGGRLRPTSNRAVGARSATATSDTGARYPTCRSWHASEVASSCPTPGFRRSTSCSGCAREAISGRRRRPRCSRGAGGRMCEPGALPHRQGKAPLQHVVHAADFL